MAGRLGLDRIRSDRPRPSSWKPDQNANLSVAVTWIPSRLGAPGWPAESSCPWARCDRLKSVGASCPGGGWPGGRVSEAAAVGRERNLHCHKHLDPWYALTPGDLCASFGVLRSLGRAVDAGYRLRSAPWVRTADQTSGKPFQPCFLEATSQALPGSLAVYALSGAVSARSFDDPGDPFPVLPCRRRLPAPTACFAKHPGSRYHRLLCRRRVGSGER
jgi:hypothetical protein